MDEKRVEPQIRLIIIKNNQVLLEKDKRGDWTLPGGSMRFGEEFEQTSRRIAKDNLGLNLKKVKVICVNNDVDGKEHNITVGTLSEEWDGEPVIKNTELFGEISWFAIEDSPFPVHVPSAKVLLNFKKGKFYFMN